MNKKITKIEVQKKNKNRVNIFIDYEFAFSCSSELIYYHKLKTGEEINFDEFKSILEEDNYLKAKDIALKYIERYFRSEKQVENKLIEKEFNSEIIERVNIFLKEYGFINDEKLTQMYIADNKKKYGKIKLKNNLLVKGISEEIIIRYLNEINNDEVMLAAIKHAEKRYYQLINSENNMKVINKKIGEYLLRQGYNFEIVKSVINKLIPLNEEIESYNKKDLSKLESEMTKKYNNLLRKEDDIKIIKKKLYDYLLRKGYNYEDIKNCFNKTIQEGY